MNIRRTSMRSFLTKSFVVSAIGLSPLVASAQALVEAADAKKENAVVADTVVDANVRSAAYASYMRHEYALQADGNLKGKVRMVDSGGALTPARVKLFFVRHGEIISQASPNAEGVFQATGLTPGYYSVVADGASGVSSTGVRIVPPPEKVEAPKANTIGRQRLVSSVKADADAKQAEAPGADWLYITPIPMIDVAAADRINELQNGPRVSAAGKPSPIQTVSANEADRVFVTASDASILEMVTLSADLMAEAYERSAYYLDSNGKMLGQLRHFDDSEKLVPSAYASIFFLQQGRVVARATSNGQGLYEVSGLVPGTYSFVVAGNDQFGAVGIQVYPAPAELVPPSNIKSVSLSRAALQSRGSGPSGGGGRGSDNNAARGGGGGGGGGGGLGGGGPGGGGGGGGGFGGLGGLGGLGMAGAAAAAAAAAGGNNNSGGATSGNNNSSQ